MAEFIRSDLRFRRHRPNLERRAGAWLRDFHTAALRPDLPVSTHLEETTRTTEQSARITSGKSLQSPILTAPPETTFAEVV